MPEFMRESDAFSWYLESDPVLRSTVVSVMWFETGPDWERLVARLDGATRLAPYFRRRLVDPPARLTPPKWVVDPNFDVSWHLDRIYAPPSGGEHFVMQVARREAMTAFDPIRPLWRFTLIEGLDGDGAALVMKMHHSLVDGVGAMQLAFSLFDEQPDPDRVPEFPDAPGEETADPVRAVRDHVAWRSGRAAHVTSRLAWAMVPTALSFARRPVSSVRSSIDLMGSVGRTVAPLRETLSPVMTGRGIRRHLDFVELDLDDLRAAAKAAGGTVNDGFLAAATGALRLYHEAVGAPVDRLRLMMPINLRKPDDPAGGNRITLLRFEVPVQDRDAARRLADISRRSQAMRSERSLPYTNSIAGVLNLVPPAFVSSIFKHVDFVASDVPGLPRTVFLAGAPVIRHVAFGPTTGTAMNLTLLSYGGSCSIGVTMDTAAVSDPELMIECLHAGVEEVLRLAGSPPRRAGR
jgi:WS/DGAT/MGAT family acyltransferase